MKKYIFTTLLSSLLLVSCGGKGKFKVSGTIEGASDTTQIVLESADNGRWFFVDSVKPNSKGKISVSVVAPEFPDIYRLRCGHQSIYFPIDSVEHLTIETKLSSFALDYTLGGTDNATAVMNVDKKAQYYSKMSAEEQNALKKEFANTVLADPSSMVAYYIICKHIGDKPLFDYTDSFDYKIIAAVGNAFHTFRPNDPRTKFLVNAILANQKSRKNVVTDTVFVEETPILNIALQDEKGVMQELKDVITKGNVVVLNFTLYNVENSPLLNKIFADLYTKYKSRGFEIYQIGFDNSEFQWRQSAKNIPWISVYDPAGLNSRNLTLYNIQQLPTTYIIDRNGEIVERVEDVTKLETSVAKLL